MQSPEIALPSLSRSTSWGTEPVLTTDIAPIEQNWLSPQSRPTAIGDQRHDSRPDSRLTSIPADWPIPADWEDTGPIVAVVGLAIEPSILAVTDIGSSDRMTPVIDPRMTPVMPPDAGLAQLNNFLFF